MANPTEFAIAVKSEDPKKKDKPEDADKDKDKAEGSSKTAAKKDGKEDEAEELVGDIGHGIVHIMLTHFIVRRGPSAEKRARNARRTTEGRPRV
jgi:hypothetical protein